MRFNIYDSFHFEIENYGELRVCRIYHSKSHLSLFRENDYILNKHYDLIFINKEHTIKNEV